ncbi:ladderlectin-like [Poecilia latipinna]|uniref:ladderlectin-like n=1 Tax=Poecilia latipinna TaxID=48699 RepID=UPI00072E965E|nr:PREDICTED: ladderlectin-like [Poecilia latipinna]
MKLLSVFLLLFSITEKCSLAHGDEKANLLQRSVECPSGWTAINDRCFRYAGKTKTFPPAEEHSLTLEANLASVHSKSDYEQIQKLVLKATGLNTAAWIGGSNTLQSRAFKWNDGTPMTYTN